MTCKHKWCDASLPDHFEHSGILATVSAGGNDIDVRIYLDTDPDDGCLAYSFDWEWSIATGDVSKEFAVLRSLLDQVEAVIREAEKVYPREIPAGGDRVSPLNGNSYPRRDLMYRVTCQSCGNTATPENVKRDGWKPVTENGRITAAICNECHGGTK